MVDCESVERTFRFASRAIPIHCHPERGLQSEPRDLRFKIEEEMRITRGPSRDSGWPDGKATTDSKEPGGYLHDWKYRWDGAHGCFEGGNIVLKGTKKRDARRNAELEVWISDEDVCALFNALLERKAEDERRLRDSLRKIGEIVECL